MNKKYKINIHIIEACNYKCKHCFAKFDSKQILPIEQWKKVVDNIIDSINVSEFNIAGGEPLLYRDLLKLVQHIKEKECKCSIISNGSLMTNEWIELYAKYFDTIGLSIDSLIPDTLYMLGRIDKNQSFITVDRLKEICDLIKKINPKCKIKINTVVSQYNKNENLYEMMKHLKIDRWKIIKMRQFDDGTTNNTYLAVSREEFNEFILNNIGILTPISHDQSYVCEIDGLNIVIEEDLEGGYLIVDSNGYLIDNTNTMKHKVVANLIDKKNIDLLLCSNFNQKLYESRYK